jgi:RHH-type proline utilization regulon transcriptional repressor/proline dehydrogenase/delta 1-pyrroline-5-carboxylate dehydrogenase
MTTLELQTLRETMNKFYRADEAVCVETLLDAARLPEQTAQKIQERAEKMISAIRAKRLKQGGVDAFLKEYDLSGEEGIALMCLAEAMLRIPDKATQDKLIADKIAMANWSEHSGKSDSLFVNAATWGLVLTGKILSQDSSNGLMKAFKSMVQKISGPMVRVAVGRAMKMLGSQFVMGETIEEAQKRAEALESQGYLFSYDMLGEAARTTADAERYMQSYLKAIDAIGAKSKGRPTNSSGISIKLSALYPRYEFAHHADAVAALIPKLTLLTQKAKQYNINLTVDAEEADRLELSLDIISQVFCDPQFSDWEGFGLAVQSYQKRAYYLLDWLIALTQQQNKRMFVRLIKGAYWDSEIKFSQVGGFEGYPVFTRKAATDVSFIACARKMLAHPESFYGQFATHNAFSVAAVMELAGERKDFEFQCLHGMGYTLYDEVLKQMANGVPCRVYAPVGGHEDLLAYLVRRLLENGANSSFVNQILDENISAHVMAQNPVIRLAATKPKANPYIPLPRLLYGEHRLNSLGIDFSNSTEFSEVQQGYQAAAKKTWQAKPTLATEAQMATAKASTNPANGEKVGEYFEATVDYFEPALARATQAFTPWAERTIEDRAAILEKAADLLEQNRYELMWLATNEAGKTLFDANAEVREAVDFCRYYAQMARETLKPLPMPGPTGESNVLTMHGRGVIACVSPWNFPLAIFLGQVTAALVAGNVVMAKPAGQTPLIAAKAVALLHEAGVPQEVLQLVLASGRLVGEKLIADERIKGVIFTGSTDTAQNINQTLAARKGAIVPLIAETGGQNAMIVDSSALPEQVVQDVITSAFGSTGQRCSALRVLFIQEDIADKTITMLKGAMAELSMGNPALLATDIGPAIDEAAKKGLLAHRDYLNSLPGAKLIAEVSLGDANPQGSFFAPCAYEIPNIHVLKQEVFGPVLHVIRYAAEDLDSIIDQINSTEYGLTMGIHSRIDQVVKHIATKINAGNIYVNRNMIGAVVGVQAFGGEGLSGTGPKAGGPHYLLRLCLERMLTINTTAAGGNATLMAAVETGGD